MATKAISGVIQQIHQTALRQESADLADGELLEWYVSRHDSAAFEVLVRRHGPTVMGVGRRILRNDADAADAFQATFLVLVRKAASIRPRGMVSHWLYGVARNTAMKAKAMNHTRRVKEQEAGAMRIADGAEDAWQQDYARVDEEMGRLPDKYRAPIVLCDLEGKTIREAARHLNWPQGTLATRLAQGRRMLARRLSKHGLALLGGVVATPVSHCAASASVPVPLISTASQAASLFGAGKAATSDVVSATVIALTEGVLKTMLRSKLKVLVTALIVFVALAGSAGFLIQPAEAQKPSPAAVPEPEKPAKTGHQDEAPVAVARQLELVPWNLTHVGHAGPTIDISDTPVQSVSGGLSKDLDFVFPPIGLLSLEGLTVARGAKVTLDGKAAKFQDLHAGLQAKLRFAEGKLEVIAIDATTRRAGHVVKAINVAQNTLTVAVGNDTTLQDLPMMKDVYIYLYDKGNVGSLADLEVGMRVSLQLTVQKDRLVVKDIRARKYPPEAVAPRR